MTSQTDEQERQECREEVPSYEHREAQSSPTGSMPDLPPRAQMEDFLRALASLEHTGRPPGFVDIHIYDDPPPEEEDEAEQAGVEGAITEPIAPAYEGAMQQQQAWEEHQQHEWEEEQQRHTTWSRQRRGVWLLIGCLLLCGLLASTAFAVLRPALFPVPEATITIVPVSQAVSTHTTLTLTTAATRGPTTGTSSLPAQRLPAVTMSQERTAPTTGTMHQEARAAHGVITFYNAATVAQSIPAGTLLVGTSGVQVVTEQDASVPAAVFPTFGSRSVETQAVTAGPIGNIAAGDIYGPCCRASISAVNTALSGGQQARDSRTVTTQDISTIATALHSSLVKSAQAALQTQVQPGDSVLTPLSCQEHITSNPQPGAEASSVQVTVSETCRSLTYSTAAFAQMSTQDLAQAATAQGKQGYLVREPVQETVTRVTRDGVTAHVAVTIAGTLTYQFSQAQQQHLLQRVTGQTKAEATTTLSQQPGVQSVAIQTTDGGHVLPTDPSRVHLVVVSVGGAS